MKLFVIAALLAVVTGESSYKVEEYAQEPHSFAWEVKDAESYNDFSHNHNNDGKLTTGSYRVLLPDGRTQTITYTSDSYRGYEVDVKYNGYAKYEEYKPVSYPTYKPVATYPAYQPAATYPVYQPAVSYPAYKPVAYPVYKTYRPVYTTAEPVYTTAEPIYSSAEPVYTTPKPVYTTTEPVYTTAEPVNTTPKPVYTPAQYAPTYPAYQAKAHPKWFFKTQ